MAARTKFYLDKQDAKWMGVCAGIADYTGFDITLVRVAMIVLTLATSGWVFVAYLAAGWLAPQPIIRGAHRSAAASCSRWRCRRLWCRGLRCRGWSRRLRSIRRRR